MVKEDLNYLEVKKNRNCKGTLSRSKVAYFDENTSSLDTDTEREIIEDVKEMKGDKTIIIISHRETTLKHCDVIYKIDNKKLFKIK